MAQTRFDANNLTYEILSESEKTVEVHDGSKSNGEVFIPSTISYNGNNYTVTVIGEEAFSWCSELTAVTIPNSVIYISKKAFSGCYGLTSITIPNSVTSIGERAFNNCSGLISVTIPNSVTSIGEGTFYNCTGLTMINVDSENNHYKSIDGVLFNFDATTLIQYPIGNSNTTYSIPNSVTSIGNYAFGYCSKLTSITIPNSVTFIGDKAFFYCIYNHRTTKTNQKYPSVNL